MGKRTHGRLEVTEVTVMEELGHLLAGVDMVILLIKSMSIAIT